MINKYHCRVIFYHIVDFFNYGFGHPVFLSARKSSSTTHLCNKYRSLAITLTALLFVFSATVVQAVTKTAATGNYNTAATWTPSGVPTPNDDVIVPSGVTLTVNANTAALKSITVNAGGTIIPTGARTVTATTITVNGTYINQSTGAITGTTISFGAGSLYQHAVDGGFIPIATWNANSTCEITGYTSTTGNPPNYTTIFAQSFGNFIWNCTNQTQSISLGGRLTSVAGNFTVLSTGSATFYFGNTGIGNMTIGGNYLQSGGSVCGSGWTSSTAAATRTFYIAGNFTITGGTFSLSSSNDAASATTVNIGKNFTQGSGTTITETGSSTGSAIRFVSSATPHVYTSAGTVSNTVNYVVDNGAILQMGTAASPSTITGGGSFTLQSGATLNVTSPAGISATGTNTGNIQCTGTRSYSAGNIVYAGNSTQATGNGLTAAANVSIVNTAGVTFTVQAAIAGNISMVTGATANLGTGFVHTAKSLTLGSTNEPINNTYGGNSSSASQKRPVFFPNTATGIISLGDCIAGSWTGSISTDWHTAGNWCSNTVPTSADNVVINAGTNQPLISAAAVCNNITINSGATVTISGTNNLTVSGLFNNNGSFTTNGGTLTVAGAFTNGGSFYGNTGYLILNSSTTSAFTNNGTFTAGNGTVNLNGGAQTVVTPSQTQFYNVIVGGTGLKTINTTNFVVMGTLSMEMTGTLSGLPVYGVPATLQYNKPAAFTTSVEWPATFTSTGGVVVKNTGVITLNANKTLTNCPLTVWDAAELAMSNFTLSAPNAVNLYCGGASKGATLSGTGLFTPGGNVNVTDANNGTAGATISCPVALTAAPSRIFTVADDGTSAVDLTISGIISNTGNLVKEGAGTLALSGANTYTGGTTLNAGTLAINNARALGAAAGVFTINGGEIDNTSAGVVTLINNNPLALNADLDFTGTQSLNLGTGIITMNEDRTITTNANTLTLGGSLLAGSYNLTKAGAGILSFGSQTVTLNNLNISAGGLTSTSGNLSIAGDLVNSGTFTHNNGTVTFNGTGAQNINNGVSSFYNFTVTNTSATCTADNSITSTGTFATSAGSTLDMRTFPLSVAVVNHAGTLLTQNTSPTPITSGKTWGGLVNYNGTAAQTAMAGTYNDLTVSTASGGAKASGDITVNGVLNLQAPNASSTVGALEMASSYAGYPATDATYLTQTTNPIVSYTLTMGPDATTVGQGDVTGKIYRNSLVDHIAYTFGNQFTTFAYTVAPDDVTVTVTIGTAHGQTGVWADPLSVQRSYEMVPTGGTGGKVAMNLHYLDSELNGNTESQLVTGDYDIGPDGAPLGDEHGRSSYDFTNNYIGLSGVPMWYFQYHATTHNWRTIFTLHNYYATHTVWNGSVNSEWKYDANWSNGVPGVAMIAVIPDALTTPNDPILAADQTIGGIQILSGGILNLDGKTITLAGYNYNGWEDESGLSNYAGSTVIITNTTVGDPPTITPIPISGVPDFNNLTINAGTNVTANLNSHISISGTFTNNGTFDAGTFVNIVEYNGVSQTVAAPDDNYYHLTLSGSGTKTLPSTLTVNHDFSLAGTAGTSGTTLNVGGSFTNNSSGTFNVGTVSLNGTTAQTVGGANSTTFTNLTINNANGVMLGNNETVNGILTLTGGVISTYANTLTVGCSGSISGADALKYIEGKLARVYCNELSKDFPIGKAGFYRPMTLAYTVNTSSTVTAEEFESTTMSGTLPAFTSLLYPNRYWTVSETGSGHAFNITLDGTGLTIPGVPVILNDFTNPFTSYPATAAGNNYTASGISHFGNFEIASLIPTSIWIGTTSNDWNTPANWYPVKVPASGDNVEFATPTNYGSVAVNDLVMDQNRIIGSLTNATTKNLIIPAGKSLIVNEAITTDNDPYRIQIQADATNPNASLIFTKPELNSSVYATVQMYSKAQKLVSPVTYTIDGVTYSSSYSWQFFGIPVKEVAALPAFYGSAVKIYEESQNLDERFKKWTSLGNSSSLYAFKGYEITQPAPKTIEIQGILNTGDKTLQLTRNLSPTIGSINYGSGQNIFGNSFTAAIDISQIQFPEDVDKTVYMYNTGSFGSWYGTTGTGATGTTPGTYFSIPQNASPVIGQEIPSMQGFLLKVLNQAAGTYTVTIPYNSISTIANTTQQRVKAASRTSDEFSYMTVDVVGANGGDRVWLFSQPGTSHGFDNGWDGEKIIMSAGTVLYADEESGIYQVNTVDDLEGSYLSFRAGSDTNYTLQINKANLSGYPSLYLTDLVTGEETDLSATQTAGYSFTATNTASFDKRFVLSRISKIGTGSPSMQGSLLKVYSTGKTVRIQNETNENGSYELFDLVGKELYSGVFRPRTTTEINTGLSEGVYLVKLRTADINQSEKVLLK